MAGRTHSHGLSTLSGDQGRLELGGGARFVLVAFIVVAAALTVIGLVALWPSTAPRVSDPSAAFAAPGVTFPHAEVVGVQAPCRTSTSGSPDSRPSGTGATCGQLQVRLGGASQRSLVTVSAAPEVLRSGLRAGDSVELMRTPAATGLPVTYSFFSVDRGTPLWVLAVIFVLVVAAVARLRGLLALVGLGVSAAIVARFMLPALLAGESGVGVAVVGSAAIMIVVLYLAHGVSLRTSAALAGTLLGVLITSVVGGIAITSSRLSGISDETGALLSSFAGSINFQGLLTCAVIIAGLGVLNDVTITQASAVWELRAAAPDRSRRELFTSAMRIGRDHIASTIYTIVFAYAGTALPVLLLLYFYQRPIHELLSTEDIAEEIVRTLASAIGLVLAVPLTTAIAVATLSPARTADR